MTEYHKSSARPLHEAEDHVSEQNESGYEMDPLSVTVSAIGLGLVVPKLIKGLHTSMKIKDVDTQRAEVLNNLETFNNTVESFEYQARRHGREKSHESTAVLGPNPEKRHQRDAEEIAAASRYHLEALQKQYAKRASPSSRGIKRLFGKYRDVTVKKEFRADVQEAMSLLNLILLPQRYKSL